MKNFSKNISWGEIIKKFIFSLLVIFPIICMYYADSMRIWSCHELFMPQGRGFFLPEHGRYIATAFNNFLFEKLPVILNTHVLDLKSTWIAFFIVAVSFAVFSLTAYGIVLFQKNNKNKWWYWLIFYLMSFFLLFNLKMDYLKHYDGIEYFEYVASLIPHLLALIMTFYFFVTDKIPSKPVYALFLVTTFFAGITVEQLNVSYMTFITAITFFTFLQYKKSKNNLSKQKLKMFSFGFVLTLIAFRLYFLNPSDHSPIDKYMTLYGSSGFFIEIAKKIILNYASVYVPLIAGIIAVASCKDSQGKKLILAVGLNIFSIFVYYFFVYYYIYCHYNVPNLLVNDKYFILLYPVLLLQTFALWDFFFETKNIKDNSLKALFLLFFILLNISYLDKFWFNLYYERNGAFPQRQRQYCFEKYMMEQVGQETIFIPAFDDNYYDYIQENLLYSIFILHYPDFKNVKTVIEDKNLNLDDLIKKEQIPKKGLKFSNLLKHKVMKYKGKYFFMFEKFKEDENYNYYRIKY